MLLASDFRPRPQHLISENDLRLWPRNLALVNGE